MAPKLPEAQAIYSPPQLARRYGVAVEKVIRWILAGELVAMNLATRTSGRPRYKISTEAVEAFEARRAVIAPSLASRRKKKPSLPTGFVRHFR